MDPNSHGTDRFVHKKDGRIISNEAEGDEGIKCRRSVEIGTAVQVRFDQETAWL